MFVWAFPTRLVKFQFTIPPKKSLAIRSYLKRQLSSVYYKPSSGFQLVIPVYCSCSLFDRLKSRAHFKKNLSTFHIKNGCSKFVSITSNRTSIENIINFKKSKNYLENIHVRCCSQCEYNRDTFKICSAVYNLVIETWTAVSDKRNNWHWPFREGLRF